VLGGRITCRCVSGNPCIHPERPGSRASRTAVHVPVTLGLLELSKDIFEEEGYQITTHQLRDRDCRSVGGRTHEERPESAVAFLWKLFFQHVENDTASQEREEDRGGGNGGGDGAKGQADGPATVLVRPRPGTRAIHPPSPPRRETFAASDAWAGEGRTGSTLSSPVARSGSIGVGATQTGGRVVSDRASVRRPVSRRAP